MDGLEVNGVSLYLTHIPNRESLVFCFVDGGSLYPVQAISDMIESEYYEITNRK